MYNAVTWYFAQPIRRYLIIYIFLYYVHIVDMCLCACAFRTEFMILSVDSGPQALALGRTRGWVDAWTTPGHRDYQLSTLNSLNYS